MKLKVTKWKHKENTKYSEDSLIRISKNNAEYGSMMLTAHTIEVDDGYVNPKVRVGFITSTVERLQKMVEDHNLVDGSNFSALIGPHRIAVIEKLESEIEEGERGFTEKINPSTGEVLKVAGETIYRKTKVVVEGSDIVDKLISHDREPAIDKADVDFKKNQVVAEL